MSEARGKVFEALRRLAIAKGQEVTIERIQIYVEYLSKFDGSMVMLALKQCFEEVKFFPDIAEIIKRINGDAETLAQEIQGKIMQAVELYGYSDPSSARNFIGDSGWRVVESCGGWLSICQCDINSIGMLRAHIDKSARSVLKLAASGDKQIEGERTNKQQEIGSVYKELKLAR